MISFKQADPLMLTIIRPIGAASCRCMRGDRRISAVDILAHCEQLQAISDSAVLKPQLLGTPAATYRDR